MRDLLALTTTRVSVAEDGLQRVGNSGVIFDIGNDGQLDISDDGRYVVFMSRAPLAPGDVALCSYKARTGNCPDIYLRDRVASSHDAGQRRARRRRRTAPATSRR